MTTDRYPKVRSESVGGGRIVAIAKGQDQRQKKKDKNERQKAKAKDKIEDKGQKAKNKIEDKIKD